MAGRILFGLALLCSGCTTIHDPQSAAQAAQKKALRDAPDHPTTSVGVATAARVRQDSDFAIIVPGIEHVVWGRDFEVAAGERTSQMAPPREDSAAPARADTTRTVAGLWPLLAVEGDFDTQIGEVEMCQGVDGFEACDPDRYRCVTSKMGNYCMERRRA
jgi:hypothetical protein